MKLWNNVTETKKQILDRVDHLLEDWHAAKNTHKKNQQCSRGRNCCCHARTTGAVDRQEQAGMRWQKPEMGRYKVGILMFRFQIIRTKLILVCISVMMKAVVCACQNSVVHLYALWI
ncbi:hypothetical protein P8452_04237 [Trifolium repens]|nr:hypothetical protein P8452_04237 [Trifolium repens]